MEPHTGNRRKLQGSRKDKRRKESTRKEPEKKRKGGRETDRKGAKEKGDKHKRHLQRMLQSGGSKGIRESLNKQKRHNSEVLVLLRLLVTNLPESGSKVSMFDTSSGSSSFCSSWLPLYSPKPE